MGYANITLFENVKGHLYAHSKALKKAAKNWQCEHATNDNPHGIKKSEKYFCESAKIKGRWVSRRICLDCLKELENNKEKKTMAQIPKPPNDKRLKEIKNRHTKEEIILQLFNLEKKLNEQRNRTCEHGNKIDELNHQIKVTADQHKENMKNKDAKIDELKKMVENSNKTFDATSKEIENLCTQNIENKEAWKKARKEANEKADEIAVLNGMVAGQDDQISNLTEQIVEAGEYQKKTGPTH